MNEHPPLLETRDLALGYRPPRHAPRVIAEHLHLRLSAGEMVCLIGPNGAGKSTLVRTLAGMQAPLNGQVCLGGIDLHRLPPGERAKRLAVVLTERPNVGLLSGYALVALGRHPYSDWSGRLSRRDEAVIRWAVEAVGALDLAARPIMELSDGQQQKLMIARALAQEPALLLLDEPTAFLDLPRRVEMMQLLKELTCAMGCAVLVSTHELDLALRTADTVWLMSGGQIRAGAPEDLVLGGAFEAAFADEGVLFDRETGSFSRERAIKGIVTLIGDGIAHVWTRRALERAGFALSRNGTPPDATVEITGDETSPVWLLCRHGQQTRHATIGALLAALNNPTDKESPP